MWSSYLQEMYVARSSLARRRPSLTKLFPSAALRDDSLILRLVSAFVIRAAVTTGQLLEFPCEICNLFVIWTATSRLVSVLGHWRGLRHWSILNRADRVIR